MMSMGIVGLTLVSAWLGLEPGQWQAPTQPQQIVNGSAVQTCGWPTTVLAGGGCTGTLVHPRVISTAQHCGVPGSVTFGEAAGSGGPSVDVVTCVGEGSDDAMLCELAEEVPLAVTPVLFGCELDGYMQVGQEVVIAGFGQTSFGMGGGTKLWAPQVISAVEPGRTIIGNAGDGTSPCPGDSGGPVFVQVADGSWRVFGTVLGGTTGVPCNSAADFQRIDPVVPNFEMQTGIDITPCFDGQTGAWDPGPDCGGFFAGDHTEAGTWNDWCAAAPVGGFSDECGAPFDDGSGGSSGGMNETGDGSSGDVPPGDGSTGGGSGIGSTGDGGATTEATTQTDPGATSVDTSAMDDDGDGQGCGCRQGPMPLPAGALLMMTVLGLRRRR
ncbi:MAG: trypsin-like serine protease [Myxococcota bacterium]